MNKIEEIKEEIKGLYKAVQVVQTTDVEKLYEDLVKCMEDWMQEIDLIGEVECVLYQNEKLRTDVFATFDFDNKQFSITTGEDSDDFFCLGIFSKSLEPRWYIYYIKVLSFYAKIDEIITTLRKSEREFEEDLMELINLTIKLQKEHLPKLQAIEQKLTADAVEKKLTADEEVP